METKNKLSSLLGMESLTLDKAESLCRTREVTDKKLREMTNEAVNVHYMGSELKRNCKTVHIKNGSIQNSNSNISKLKPPDTRLRVMVVIDQ